MSPPIPANEVASPCVRTCCLDDDDVCIGCGRALAEIVAWGTADDPTRRDVRKYASANNTPSRPFGVALSARSVLDNDPREYSTNNVAHQNTFSSTAGIMAGRSSAGLQAIKRNMICHAPIVPSNA